MGMSIIGKKYCPPNVLILSHTGKVVWGGIFYFQNFDLQHPKNVAHTPFVWQIRVLAKTFPINAKTPVFFWVSELKMVVKLAIRGVRGHLKK